MVRILALFTPQFPWIPFLCRRSPLLFWILLEQSSASGALRQGIGSAEGVVEVRGGLHVYLAERSVGNAGKEWRAQDASRELCDDVKIKHWMMVFSSDTFL